MAVLRCPNCGKTVSKDSSFCNHCGAEIDKPVVDTFWSGQQEGTIIVFKAMGVLLLWFLVVKVWLRHLNCLQ